MECDSREIRGDLPACSVCIANYNGMGVIEACLRSVITQNVDFQIEIIVHDDASTDGSVEFIREHFPQVRLIESRENVGFCVSNNRMAAEVGGQYILLLNNDAELLPDALRKLYDYARKQQATTEGLPLLLGLPQYNAATGNLIDRGAMLDPFLNSLVNFEHEEVGMVCGACLWIPKNIWDEIGGFPDFFHTLAEDMYLCCRARLKGCSVKVLKDSGFNHWVGATLGGGKVSEHRLSTSFRRRSLTERNKCFAIAICYPFPIFQIIFPIHLILLIAEGAALSLIKRNPIFLKQIYLPAIRELWHQREMIFSLRQKVQAERRISIKKFFKVFCLIPYKLKMLMRYGLPEVR